MKYISILLSIVMAIVLISCGGSSSSENTEAVGDVTDEIIEEVEALAEEGLGQDLSSDDVEKFIKSFPSITKELDELGEEYDANDQVSYEAVFTAPEVIKILEKYDWKADEFMTKYMVIANGYAYLKMEEQLDALNDDEKKIAGTMMEQSIQAFKNFVNDDQLGVIKEHMDDLNPVFEEMN